MENTTRIADLPDNITVEAQENDAFDRHSQMNIHPNPYMAQAQHQLEPSVEIEMPRMPKQIPIEMQHQMQQQIQQQMQQQMQQHRLPSRDIPMDQTQYTQDVQITPNYIPQAHTINDYVRDKETLTNEKLRQFEEKRSRLDKIDQILTEFQTPVFIMLLFFLFHLPLVNTMIFKKFSFLAIVNDDGNFNTFGLACKSALFGTLFYCVSKFTNYIIEL